ncbi:uncharacterized protein [Nicotiana sylvestris]|uniref:uncharacterized protein n=1 Tax=Nicotiana sylvestris TaxID=4096 RepID=UPI00388CD4C8
MCQRKGNIQSTRGNPCWDLRSTYERFCLSKEDTLGWLLLDDYGNRLHPVCSKMPPLSDTCRHDKEVVIPGEFEIPSLRIIQEAEFEDAKWVKSHYEKLALIDGKRMNAVCHGQLYQNRMSRAFNKRFKPRQFAPGQSVLKKIFPHQDEAKGKFSPNWQGPYMVHRVLTGGALILAEMDGEVLSKPINSNAIKHYYV